ncbi:MAG: HAMP domain-containing sensor histidine kinase [Myxococcota bacterium]
MNPPYEPRAWHLAVVLVALAAIELTAEQLSAARARAAALRASDAAVEGVVAAIQGPVESRRGALTVDGRPLDLATVRVGGGFAASASPAASACRGEAAEQVVLIERRVWTGITRGPAGDRAVESCAPLRDRYGQVVGVVAVRAPEAVWLGSPWPIRILVGGTFAVLAAMIAALGWVGSRSIRALEAEVAALRERDATNHTAVAALNDQVDGLTAERDELSAALADAEARTAARSAFLANLCTELRPPLVTVIDAAAALDGEAHGAASRIADTARVVVGSLDDVRDVVRLEAAELSLDLAPFDLRPVLDELVASASAAAAIGGNTLTLSLDPSFGDRPIGLVNDAARLRQVLANLLSNAAKFTENGEIVLSVEPAPLPAAYDPALDAPTVPMLRFVVRDTGIGMTETRLILIFDLFHATDHHATVGRGLGLGLTLVRLLTEAMGGAVSADSQLGVGSAFAVEIPREVQPRATAPGDG